MKKSNLLRWVMLCLLVHALLGGTPAIAIADESSDQLDAIVNLICDKDKDMRALGLQQVREEAKGEAATKRLATLLPKLEPEAQAGLLDALADRGDRAARPAVLEMVKSPAEQVRTAALRAVGSLARPPTSRCWCGRSRSRPGRNTPPPRPASPACTDQPSRRPSPPSCRGRSPPCASS